MPSSVRELDDRRRKDQGLRLYTDILKDIQQLISRLVSSTELRPLLEEVLDATMAIQGADFGTVQLYNRQTRVLEIVAQRGFERDFLDHFRKVDDITSVCGRAIQAKGRVIVEDVQADPAFEPHRQIAAAAGFRAAQSTPLFARGGRLLGMVSTHFRQPHRPSPRELELTDLYVSIAAEMIERTQFEDRLHRSEERLQAILDNSTNLIFLKDPEGHYLLANKEFERFCRLSQPQIRGKRDDQIFPPEQAATFRAHDLAVLHSRVAMEFEETAAHDDGLHTSIVHKFPLLDREGKTYATGGIVTDITARKRTEEQLRKSEERWRAVFENSAVGIALTDCISTRFQAANMAFQKMVGYSEDELRASTFVDITYEDDREPNRRLLSEVLEGRRQSFAMEKRYRRKDDSLIWVNLHVSLVPGTESIPRFSLAIVEDITERKRAEEELRRSEAYLAEGQRLSHTGSWALNLNSGDLYWSQETYRIFGLDPAKTTATLKEAFLQSIHPEDRPRIEQGLSQATNQKGYHESDYRIVLPGGSIRYIHEAVYPVTNEAGEVTERYGLAMDVTERKRAEEELQRSRDQLRALAARLQKIREEEQTRLAREIHDEMGQALTAIKIELSSLSHDLPPDKKQSAEYILQLVDETIQSVRRISSELRPVILDAVGLVGAVKWAAGEFEARTGIKCRLDLPPVDTHIDPERGTALFRIFQETLTNVARHANATEVEVRLAKADGNLTLEVHDNGRGICQEQLSEGGSLGILGMRERALLLGGELTIAGTRGEGTTVSVRIPESPPRPPKDDK
jgi:PAS domain S-box-containing protein